VSQKEFTQHTVRKGEENAQRGCDDNQEPEISKKGIESPVCVLGDQKSGQFESSRHSSVRSGVGNQPKDEGGGV